MKHIFLLLYIFNIILNHNIKEKIQCNPKYLEEKNNKIKSKSTKSKPKKNIQLSNIFLISKTSIGKTDDWPLMSHAIPFLIDFLLCCQHLSEYDGLLNMEQGFYGEPALNNWDKP